MSRLKTTISTPTGASKNNLGNFERDRTSRRDGDCNGYNILYTEMITFIVIVIVSLSILSFLIATVYFGLFYHNPPIEFNNLPFPVNQEVYETGDLIIIDADFCRYAPGPFSIAMEFSNSIVVQIPEVSGAGREPGCYRLDFALLQVPKHIPSGQWFLRGKSTFKVGPFGSERTVIWTTEPFEVIEK